MSQPRRPSIYVKHHSFDAFRSRLAVTVEAQRDRAIAALNGRAKRRLPADAQPVLAATLTDLTTAPDVAPAFRITPFIADEMSLLPDSDLPRYLFHRYRYDVFPAQRTHDAYPPCLQIEPASMCNYRCVFCYQTDRAFAGQKGGHMGAMSLALFRAIVDQCNGHVEFVTLASRGEPLLCPDLPAMLEYCRGKFLNLKVNTNGSRLTESLAHALLAGDVRTLVFSADAATPAAYRRYRRPGTLSRVLNNIRMFQRAREQHYPKARIVTRVSGVLYEPERQDLEAMVRFWGDLVDQVTFVRYNPWVDLYAAAPSGVTAPCSDLWRRMFIWWDGRINPCDTDYRSTLSTGRIQDTTVNAAWHSPAYQQLRELHLAGRRGSQEPCRRCCVT